jgi:hypothetical protein
MVQALAFAELLLGGVLFLSGWKGYSPAEVVKGEAGEGIAPKPLGAGGSSSTAPSSSAAGSPTGPLSGASSSSLPHTGAKFELKQKDQGRDVQLEPGATIGGPGAFRVVAIGSDPKGFGPNYPIIEVLTGAFKGHKLYAGHTHALLPAGRTVYPAGTPFGQTGTTPVGNATVPGWLEFGYADSGSPGPVGQASPF